MVVHEQYELFVVHSHDYEPLVHDIFIFIFTGSRVSPNSYSWVHKIFMNLFMGLQCYIHGFKRFSKKYSWIPDIKFMTSRCQIHEFTYFFMNFSHTTYEHIHSNGSWLLFTKQLFFKELNKRVKVMSYVISVSHLENFGNKPLPKPKKNITSIILLCRLWSFIRDFFSHIQNHKFLFKKKTFVKKAKSNSKKVRIYQGKFPQILKYVKKNNWSNLQLQAKKQKIQPAINPKKILS